MIKYSFYIGGVKTEEPLGWDAAVLKRSRSKQYGGFLFMNLAYLEGVRELTITDPLIVDMLSDAFERDGANAETNFEIRQNDEIRFSGVIDYPSSKHDERSWQIMIRDKNAVSEFVTNLDTDYRIDVNEDVRLHGMTYIEGVTHKIGDITNVSNGGTSVSMVHAPPFKAQSNNTLSGTALTVSYPLNLEPVYQNTTGKSLTITIYCKLVFDNKASASGTFTVQTVNDATETTEATISISTTQTARSTTFSRQITVAAGKFVYIKVGGSQPTVNNFDFFYDASQTVLSIERTEVPVETIANSIKLSTITKALIEKASDSKLKYSSTFFDSLNYYVTNGKCLRVKTNDFINISLSDVLMSLHAIHNIQIDIQNDTVSIYQRNEQTKRLPIYDLGTIDKLTWSVNMEHLYSSIQVGSDEWKANSPFSEDELNAQRTYDLPLKVSKNDLQLRSKLITSSYIIEECRQAQFDGPKNNNFRFDNKNFLISCKIDSDSTVRAERGSDFSVPTDTMDTDNVYNARFMPDVTLLSWANWLGDGTATLTTHTGNLGGVAIESKTLRSLFTGKTVTIELQIELEEYQDIGTGFVRFTWQGGTYLALLADITLKPSRRGATMADIVAWETRSDTLNNLTGSISWLEAL